jgi:hypothetical protein
MMMMLQLMSCYRLLLTDHECVDLKRLPLLLMLMMMGEKNAVDDMVDRFE